MRLIRAGSCILGFGALIFTGLTIWRNIESISYFQVLWRVTLMWPLEWYYLPKAVIFNPGLLLHLSFTAYLYIIVALASPFFAIALSKRLDRSRLDWFVLTFLFPFCLALLVVLPRGRASSNPYGGVLGHFFAACTGKFCGRCGKAVPLSSRAGQNCPFCHAYWSYERTIYRN